MMSEAFESALFQVAVLAEAMQSVDTEVDAGAAMLAQCIRNRRTIFTCGNGGSAADAAHMAEEFVGRYLKERRSLPAVCLNSDGALLTCIGNDYGFERLFSRQVEALGREGDVLVVFSTSGNSQNILLAMQAARQQGMKVLALLGKTGGPAKALADVAIVIPSEITARIQEMHTLIMHVWLEGFEPETP